MRYYEIEIQTNTEGADSKGIYSYDNKGQAEQVFHTKMASGINQVLEGNLVSVLNLIINENGGTVMSELFKLPDPEPEPPVGE